MFRVLPALAALAALIVFVVVPAAHADPIAEIDTWTLSNVAFLDGGTASGSFVVQYYYSCLTCGPYDNTYDLLSWDITVTDATLGNSTFDSSQAGNSGTLQGPIYPAEDPLLNLLHTDPANLQLNFDSLIPTGGGAGAGSASIGSGCYGTESNCGSAPNSFTQFDTNSSGAAGDGTGPVLTPEPPSLWLLLTGALALGAAALRQRRWQPVVPFK